MKNECRWEDDVSLLKEACEIGGALEEEGYNSRERFILLAAVLILEIHLYTEMSDKDIADMVERTSIDFRKYSNQVLADIATKEIDEKVQEMAKGAEK